MAKFAAILSAMVLLGGCQSLDDYRGTWVGKIDPSEDVRAGFAELTELTLEIVDLDQRHIEAKVTTCVRGFPDDQCATGRFEDTALVMLDRARNDDLGTMKFGGEPYAVYITTVQPRDPAEPEVLAIVSLHSASRVEVRLIRGSELYGVFRLTRQKQEE